VGLALVAVCLRAHPISLTSALVDVKDDQILVELGMMVEDLVLYYEIEPNEQMRFPQRVLIEQARAHQEFLLRYFHLRDADGRRFEGRVVEIDVSGVGEDGVRFEELMAHSIRYRLEYPLEAPPALLTIVQDFGGNQPVVPAEMEVRIFQRGVRVGPAVMLSHRSAHTVWLDPEAAAGESGDDLAAERRRMAEGGADAFGLTSYSSVYSFVYITGSEVRHELLIPLLTLETWLPLQRAESGIMSVEEQRAARPAVAEFLARHNRVEIDGVPVSPVVMRVDFFPPEFRDFARRAPERQVSVYNARVGVVLAFPAEARPRAVKIAWDYFNERLPFLRPVVYPFDGPAQDALFDFYQTTFLWKDERPPAADVEPRAPEFADPASLRIPVWTLLSAGLAVVLGWAGLRARWARRRIACVALAGGLVAVAVVTRSQGVLVVRPPFIASPAVDEAAAGAIFRALHRNAYAAFEHRTETRIYDVLERSVAGQLLEDFYLQIRRTLQAEEEGGTVSRIDAVAVRGGAFKPLPRPPGGYQAFEYVCDWTVTGTIEHWGHVHTRTNRYEAIFTVEGLPSGWRITGFQPLREEPVYVRIGLRR
jgi:hypothetical protein